MEAIIASIQADLADAEHTDDKPIIVLSGPTGIGKTALLRELGHRITAAAVQPRNHDRHFRFKPFVHSVLSTGSGPAQLAIDIRLSMGLPTPSTHYRMAHQKAKEGLAQLSAQVLVVDHVNAILSHGVRAQEDCVNVLKFLSVAAAIPIILGGTMRPEKLFTAQNDASQEMQSRAIYYRLDYWRADADFQRLLIALGEAYALDEPELLAQEQFAELIHQRSGGLTRMVCRAIRKANRLAKDDQSSFNVQHLRAAFEQMTPV